MILKKQENISGWGNHLSINAEVYSSAIPREVATVITTSDAIVARGSGCSYGDASMAHRVFSTLKLKHINSFDRQKGLIQVQSGILLAELLSITVPAGFILPVLPGTGFVTVGGAIASDVHGKNHPSQGSFSSCTVALEILLASGEVVHCSPTDHPELFCNTCGGMGLTGIILTATLQLTRITTSYMVQSHLVLNSWHHLYEAMLRLSAQPYKVAWLDLLNWTGADTFTSVLTYGRHAEQIELPRSLKGRSLTFNFEPKRKIRGMAIDVMYRFTMAQLHKLKIWMTQYKSEASIVPIPKFFFPLDSYPYWNNSFGPAGLFQYQFVLPLNNSYGGMDQIFTQIKLSGVPVFLATIKVLGPSTLASPLSFPMEGFTLALDLKASLPALQLMSRLDQVVLNNGGRVYLAKDARLTAETCHQMYPTAQRDKTIFRSLLADRLKL